MRWTLGTAGVMVFVFWVAHRFGHVTLVLSGTVVAIGLVGLGFALMQDD